MQGTEELAHSVLEQQYVANDHDKFDVTVRHVAKYLMLLNREK